MSLLEHPATRPALTGEPATPDPAASATPETSSATRDTTTAGAAASGTRVPGRNPRRRSRALLLDTAIAITTTGLLLTTATVIAPDTVDKVTGNVKVGIEQQMRQWIAPGELPQITLGGEGDLRDLDRCSGEFTEMITYRGDGILPLYSAHNYCGGDIILTWDIGQKVRITGTDTIYEVVEERHTPKSSNADTLIGMTGELMVQTCYYGENRMRFLSLAPVGQTTS